MTYIPRDDVTKIIPNKFEAVRVLSLECRRLNDEMRAREQHSEKKIATISVQRLLDGEIEYYDARERREQERSEAMLAAAEGILDTPPVAPPVSIAAVSDDGDAVVAETKAESIETVEATPTPEATETPEVEELAETAETVEATEVAEESTDGDPVVAVVAEASEPAEVAEASEAEEAKE